MNDHAGAHRHHKHRHKHHHKHHHKHSSRTDWRELITPYLPALAVALGVLVLALGGLLGWGIYQSHLYRNVHGPALEAELGFKIETLSVKAGDSRIDVAVIHPVVDGYMSKMGFRDGDIITSHTLTEFYKMLYTRRGETVSTDVAEGGDGRPVEERKQRTLRYHIPVKS